MQRIAGAGSRPTAHDSDLKTHHSEPARPLLPSITHMQSDAIERTSWPEVIAAFATFFDGMGQVQTDAETATFESAGTGISVSSDGGSRSFMPLHDLALTWETVVFDTDRYEVRLEGAGGTYTYIVPPNLRPS